MKEMHGTRRTHTIAELVSFLRAVNHASRDSLEQFVKALATDHLRVLISNYIKQFLPYDDQEICNSDRRKRMLKHSINRASEVRRRKQQQ